MTKTWEQLTEVEKIEDLRRDVVRLFDALNTTNRARAAIAAHVDEAKALARDALTAVKELNRRLDSGELARNVEADLVRELRHAVDMLPPSIP